MFQTVPLFIVRSFSLYTQQWYMSYRFADSLQAKSGRNAKKAKKTYQYRNTKNCSVLILLTSCQQTCMTYTSAVCTLKNSRWTEELSETCRVLFQK